MEAFGYLHIPRLFSADEISRITEEHRQTFERCGVTHDGSARSYVPAFLAESPRLAALLEHPAVLGVARLLLGDDFNWVGGEGNYYSGFTAWHTTIHRTGPTSYLKFHLYLDPLTRDTGALRVIPGSHLSAEWREELRRLCQPEAEDGGGGDPLEGSDIPSVAVETEPGDAVLFSHHVRARCLTLPRPFPP